MSGNNTRARGHSPIRSYRANEKTGRAERHAREACCVRWKSVRVSRYQAVIGACLTARPYVSCWRNNLFH